MLHNGTYYVAPLRSLKRALEFLIEDAYTKKSERVQDCNEKPERYLLLLHSD